MALHRDFKGVWIPKEIWLAPDLSLQEKCLLVEIGSFERQNGCYATNKHFVEFLGMSDRTVRYAIAHLKELKILSVSQKNTAGKMIRVIKTIWQRLPHTTWQKTVKPPGKDCHVSTYIHNSNTRTQGGEKKMIKINDKITKQDRDNVYKVLDAFKIVNKCYDSLGQNPKQYDAAMRLIKRFGFKNVIMVIAILPSTNKMTYVSTITTPVKLEENWSALEAQLYKEREKKKDRIII
jgi:hypothetical protein